MRIIIVFITCIFNVLFVDAQEIAIYLSGDNYGSVTYFVNNDTTRFNLGGAGKTPKLNFEIPDLDDIFRINVEGKSKVRISSILIKLDEVTMINLKGKDARAALVIPNRVKNNYYDNGDFELTSNRDYPVLLRFPIRNYYQHHLRYENNWNSKIILYGQSLRYSQLMLHWVSFGEEATQYAHYFPIKNKALDTIEFFIPAKYVQDIYLTQIKGKQCFKVIKLIYNDKIANTSLISSEKVDSDMVKVDGEYENSLCLNQEPKLGLQIELHKIIKIYIAVAKFIIFLISGVLLLFLNRIIFKKFSISFTNY